MSILRTIRCDICGKEELEPATNAGWQGWGALHGVRLNDADNPNLCPDCLGKVAEFANKIGGE